MMQRDLWAIFEWTNLIGDKQSENKRTLQLKLVQTMRRLALSPEQIKKLPHTYAGAVLSREFASAFSQGSSARFLPNLWGDHSWVCVSAEGGGPVARAHVTGFSGRSVFHVLIRLPAGRNATLSYLQALRKFPNLWIRRAGASDPMPNPALPQFPPGTELALIRQMLIIDGEGNLAPTDIIESVQIRRHRLISKQIPQGLDTDSTVPRESLDVAEFRLSRAKLFSNKGGGLRAVANDESDFPIFQSHDIDLFDVSAPEMPLDRSLHPVLNACSSCHFRPGIHSVLSRMPNILVLRERDVRRDLVPCADSSEEIRKTLIWKEKQDSWKTLHGMWRE
jgi:hypothetical protein